MHCERCRPPIRLPPTDCRTRSPPETTLAARGGRPWALALDSNEARAKVLRDASPAYLKRAVICSSHASSIPRRGRYLRLAPTSLLPSPRRRDGAPPARPFLKPGAYASPAPRAPAPAPAGPHAARLSARAGASERDAPVCCEGPAPSHAGARCGGLSAGGGREGVDGPPRAEAGLNFRARGARAASHFSMWGCQIVSARAMAPVTRRKRVCFGRMRSIQGTTKLLRTRAATLWAMRKRPAQT